MRVLVLSGGGALGAFQAGALFALSERKDFKDYNLIAGVSVGALAASFLCSCEPGADALYDRIEDYADLWLHAIEGPHDVYDKPMLSQVHPTLGLLQSFQQRALYTLGPLRHLWRATVDPRRISLGSRKLRVGAYNLDKRTFMECSESFPMLEDFVIASASIPLVFPPVQIGADTWVDGGVSNGIPVRFLEEFAGQIESIDIVLTSPACASQPRKRSVRSFQELAALSVRTVLDHVIASDVWPYIHYWQSYLDCTIRVIAPKKRLKTNPIAFDPFQVKSDFDKGMKAKPVPLAKAFQAVLSRSTQKGNR